MGRGHAAEALPTCRSREEYSHGCYPHGDADSHIARKQRGCCSEEEVRHPRAKGEGRSASHCLCKRESGKRCRLPPGRQHAHPHCDRGKHGECEPLSEPARTEHEYGHRAQQSRRDDVKRIKGEEMLPHPSVASEQRVHVPGRKPEQVAESEKEGDPRQSRSDHLQAARRCARKCKCHGPARDHHEQRGRKPTRLPIRGDGGGGSRCWRKERVARVAEDHGHDAEGSR